MKADELIDLFIKRNTHLITRDGHIFHKKRPERELGYTNKYGYREISIKLSGMQCKRSLLVHRIIWAKYGDSPLGSERTINHKDGNKLNNCIDNLEQVSDAKNLLHKYRVLHAKPVIGNCKLTKEQAEEIRELRKQGWKYEDLMKKFNVGKTTISYVVNKKIWK